MNRRTHLLMSGGLLTLTLATIYVWFAQADAYRQARTAADQLREARTLIARIQRSRADPDRLADRSLTQIEAAKLVDAACQAASLPADRIIRVWPEPARPVGDTGYYQGQTQLLVRRAPLPALGAFLHVLTDGHPGLRIEAIRLTADDRGRVNPGTASPNPPEHWTADVTLQQVFFNPSGIDHGQPN